MNMVQTLNTFYKINLSQMQTFFYLESFCFVIVLWFWYWLTTHPLYAICFMVYVNILLIAGQAGQMSEDHAWAVTKKYVYFT